jgi:D-arabinose 1-dehydrogenase-like Zn-dependent alcohol dehydrogenase
LESKSIDILHEAQDKVLKREITPRIAATYTIDQIDQAIATLQDSDTFGRVLILPA